MLKSIDSSRGQLSGPVGALDGLDDGFRFVERSHFAVHGTLYSLRHQEALDSAKVGVAGEHYLRPAAERRTPELAGGPDRAGRDPEG